MRKPILGALACLLLAFLARPAAAGEDFFAADKLSHFGTSVGVGFVADTIAYHYAKDMGPGRRTLVRPPPRRCPG